MRCSFVGTRPAAALMMAAVAVLPACGGGGASGASTSVVVPAGDSQISGDIYGGLQPVAGAVVQVYAGGADYGSAALLGSTRTDANGVWQLSFNCPNGGAQLYVVASGGDAGAGGNSAIGLSSVAGRCGGGVPIASIRVNEASTVAAAYALSAFLDASGRMPGAPAGNQTGLDNAVALAKVLVDPATGEVATELPVGALGAPPTATLNTLANILASCVESAVPTADACPSLLAAATAPDGASPTDTLQAILAIARNPGRNVAGLYALVANASSGSSSSGPYGGAVLAAAPNDWTLALRLIGGGLDRPLAVAIDAQGNAWVSNYGNALSKFAPDGRSLAGLNGYTGGGLDESFGLAIDGAGAVWVTNQESPESVNNKLGSVTRFAADGSVLSGPDGYTGGGIDYPMAVQVAPGGGVFIANYGNSSLSRLAADGTAVSPVGGFTGGGIAYPVAVAVDSNGFVWLSNHGGDSLSQLTDTGAALSPATGYVADGLAAPEGLCVDAWGRAWASSYLGDSLVVLQTDGGSAAGQVLSPTGGYGGGGLQNPSGCAVDGGGRLWVTNYTGGSFSAFMGGAGQDIGTPLSPASGYAAGSLIQPTGVAVDASGNLWVASAGDDSVWLFVGLATPVRTPLSGPPAMP